jgi:hypothetical protein
MSEPFLDQLDFDRVGEVARRAVREKIAAMLEPASVSREATHAVLLGSIAGAIECFVCAADDGTSRERLKEGLRDVVSDFVDQAKDQLRSGLT